MATETGAGQWGTALGIAISEAVEDAATHQPTTKYSLGSVLNHVLMHQTIIGLETQKQLEKANIEPDILIGCVGGGSNFGGFALPFVREKIVNKKIASSQRPLLAMTTAQLLPTVDSCLPFVYNTRKSSAVVSVKELVLRVVPLEDVRLHEQVEARRVEKLTARLQVDWLLKNPPIVTQCDGKFILLDGATRVTSLRQLGCRDVVVQIVDYARPGLVLETWNHMLIGLSMREFFESLQQLPGLRVENSVADEAGDALAQRKSIGTILLADGEAYSLRMEGASSLASEARLLNGVVAAYEGRGEMDRVAHMDVERLRSENSRLSALVIFPRYRPDEIRYLALNGSKLPTGITHHVIPGRAMRINIPLDVLRADEPLEQKNEWLDEWMKTKMREQHVRYYQEPVFLFDE